MLNIFQDAFESFNDFKNEFSSKSKSELRELNFRISWKVQERPGVPGQLA